MASQLSNDTTLNATLTLTKQSGTVLTLNTDDTYVDKDIVFTLNAQTASPAFDGGALNGKAATATFTNMTTSSTDTSGVAILAKGTAGRDAVLYNGAVNGWVSASDDASASAAISASTWNGTTYYATGVTLGNGKSFSITVPDGISTKTYTFSVNSSGVTSISGLPKASGVSF